MALGLGEAPAWAAAETQGRPAPETVSPMAAVAAIQSSFDLEIAPSRLVPVGPAEVQTVGSDGITQVTLMAVAPFDLSRSDRLALAQQSFLLPGSNALAARQDSEVDLNVEAGKVLVSTDLLIGPGIDAQLGRPTFSGLKVHNVVEIPLEDYRQAASAPDPHAAFDELAVRLSARESEVSRTTVTSPKGRSLTFNGSSMDLGDAIAKVTGAAPGNIVPLISFGCVRSCFAHWVRNIGIGAAICMAAVVVGCGASCFFIGGACIVCFRAGFLTCNIIVGSSVIVTLIACLLHCR
jgi:hypothetical protein